MRAGPSEGTEGSWGVAKVIAASLVPWLAFLAAAALADAFVRDRSIDFGGMVRSSPFYLWIISLFSFFRVLAGRSRRVQAAATVVMTAVTVWAGLAVVTVDDGQGGLAVLIVPPVGLALAVLIVVGQALTRFRARRP